MTASSGFLCPADTVLLPGPPLAAPPSIFPRYFYIINSIFLRFHLSSPAIAAGICDAPRHSYIFCDSACLKLAPPLLCKHKSEGRKPLIPHAFAASQLAPCAPSFALPRRFAPLPAHVFLTIAVGICDTPKHSYDSACLRCFAACAMRPAIRTPAALRPASCSCRGVS